MKKNIKSIKAKVEVKTLNKSTLKALKGGKTEYIGIIDDILG